MLLIHSRRMLLKVLRIGCSTTPSVAVQQLSPAFRAYARAWKGGNTARVRVRAAVLVRVRVCSLLKSNALSGTFACQWLSCLGPSLRLRLTASNVNTSKPALSL